MWSRKEPSAELSLNKLAMNVTESKAGFWVIICPIGMKVIVPGAREKTAFAINTIILNILNFYMFHVTTVMNMLVIMAVKRTRRLQSNYNSLLACLAGTDLLVGAASQPSYIVGQIYVIKGLSLSEYCQYHQAAHLMF